MTSFPRWLTLAAVVLMCGPSATSAGAALLPECSSTHWVGSWLSPPSDASRADVTALVDASLHLKIPVSNSTTRSVFTPTLTGTQVRVHVSNRFGTVPVTFDHVAIARSGSGAAVIPGSTVPLTFGGHGSITVPPGKDAVSDPASFRLEAFTRTAVSAFVRGDAGKPTEHFTARQTSYMSVPGSGDHVDDQDAGAFAIPTTGRPFVFQVDVRAPASTGAVVTFGDSITDGFQATGAAPVPEDFGTVDTDGRYPDDLARRLIAASRAMGVLNAGISGNKVLFDGPAGGGIGLEGFGPAAPKRLDADVPDDAGVTTVILLEGINDLGQSPVPAVDALTGAYTRIIERLHARGIRVLHGTLEPKGKATPPRNATNDWIRTRSPADAVVDFDAAVRDPSDPDKISPAYDGGDGLHYGLEGYRAMAAAVPLDEIAAPACAVPMRARLSPARLLAKHSATVRVTVTRAGKPLKGARVSLGKSHVLTDSRGVARLRVRPAKPGLRTVAITADGSYPLRLRLRVKLG